MPNFKRSLNELILPRNNNLI